MKNANIIGTVTGTGKNGKNWYGVNYTFTSDSDKCVNRGLSCGFAFCSEDVFNLANDLIGCDDSVELVLSKRGNTFSCTDII